MSTRSERRRLLDQELAAVQAQESRLVEAIRQGEAPVALLTALHHEQERRTALEEERQRLSQLEEDAVLDERQVLGEILASAVNFRDALGERTPEARRAIQTQVQDRMEFSPFVDDGARGYEFVGTGTYGGLLARVLLAMVAPTGHDRTCTIQVRDFIAR